MYRVPSFGENGLPTSPILRRRVGSSLFLVSSLLSLASLLFLDGCALFNQHAQMMDAMRGVMKETAARLSESGTGQIAAGGQVINPGLRVSGGVEYFVVARYEGVSGQVTAGMAGKLDRPVPHDVQSQADAIWRDASLSAEQKTRLLIELFSRRLSDGSQSATNDAGADGHERD